MSFLSRMLAAITAQQGDMDSRLRSAEAELAQENQQNLAHAVQKQQEQEAQNIKNQEIQALQQQIADYWSSAGVGYDIKGTNRAQELAQILQQNQINNLSDLGAYTIDLKEQTGFSPFQSLVGRGILKKDGTVVKPFSDIGNVDWQSGDYLRGGFRYNEDELGPVGDPLGGRFTLVSSSAGKGGHLNYDVLVDKNGNIQNIVPVWQEGSNLNFADVAPAIGIFAAPFTGGLSAALGGGTATLGSTIAANALVSGGIGGLGALSQGEDFLSGFGKGALTGGITGGIGSLVSPFASSIGADVLSSTGSQALADIASGAIKGAAGGLPSALISGDASNLLTGALAGGVGGGIKNVFSDLPESVRAPVTAAVTSGLLGRDPTEAAIRAFAGDLMKSGPTMPGAGTTEDIQEGFFEPGGPGFMPTEYLDDEEVQRELTSLLGRYPTPAAPSEWFLGENVPSGVPEWDMAAVNAGLPIGNLEQDFYVEQAKEGPRIVDSAGNVGTFVNGEFVVDTGVTPDLSYLGSITPPAPASAPTPAPTPKPPTPTPAPSPLAQFAKSLGIPQEMAAQMLQESSEADLLTMFAELSEEREKKRKERGIADLLKSRKA